MEKDGGVVQWVKDHAWKGAMAICIAYGGFATGTQKASSLQSEVGRLEARVTNLEAREKAHLEDVSEKLKGRFGFMNDASSIVNYLCQDDVGCRTRYDSLKVPE